jgi:hypothetical protein
MSNINYESKWSQMEKRLNLQSIGEFIQHGSDVLDVDKHNFIEREAIAYKKLQKGIEDTCGKEIAVDILEKVVIYSSIREDIYFSLGMKVGAQITIQLTGNLETDF